MTILVLAVSEIGVDLLTYRDESGGESAAVGCRAKKADDADGSSTSKPLSGSKTSRLGE